MIVFLALLAMIVGYKMNYKDYNEFYISKEQSTNIKGVFIAMVFLSHITGYIDHNMAGGYGYIYYKAFFAHIGQLMVTMFLFYSGFGVWESRAKKTGYINTFFKNRILKTWVHFLIALSMFVILNIAIKKNYPINIYIKSLIGWENIGNSNWYIFDILICYILSYLMDYISRKLHFSPIMEILFLTTMLIIATLIMRMLGKNTTWYNTILCYPLGALFSVERERIEGWLQKSTYYWMSLAIIAGLFVFFYTFSSIFICHILMHILFCPIIILITMKLVIGNGFLLWMGRHLFPIYILQRLPMIIFSKIGIKNAVFYTIICIIGTAILAYGFSCFCMLFDKYVFREARIEGVKM